eukprot:TRINITY_DN3544_c0_g1_i1.p1 TRINITY_DN3544_c0_g1~~TRINITY_DN3544_c0_g1_i1.p1  ORF type:complete len:469 (+),score=102.11 TRINITY_DN3544_c0_g1_i1:92-1408(+)
MYGVDYYNIVSGDSSDSTSEEEEPLETEAVKKFAGTYADINQRFQKVAQSIFSVTTYHNATHLIQLNLEFIDISKDFLHAARKFGKVIISEIFLPYDQKTVRPIQMGGVIGGEKYIVHNILFKFATGKVGAFSDEAASKIAGHELKSLVHIWNCRVPELCYPLQCLIDYLGFRLVAMILLPINYDTLKVGSSDGGKSINYADRKLVSQMRHIGQKLNLATHKFQDSSFRLPVDLEGHIGNDGRRYVVDLSRVFPPVPPSGVKNSNLWQLFRPEFVKDNPSPMCSDGFSGFMDFPDEHNLILKLAAKRLHTEVIPNFVPFFESMVNLHLVDGALPLKAFDNLKLPRLLHQAGINLRYLGILCGLARSKESRTMYLIEMVARSVKKILNRMMRKRMAELLFPMETPYIAVVRTHLNSVFHPTDEYVWKEKIYPEIIRGYR